MLLTPRGGPSAAIIIKSSKCSDVSLCLSFVHSRFIVEKLLSTDAVPIGHDSIMVASLDSVGNASARSVVTSFFKTTVEVRVYSDCSLELVVADVCAG